MSDRRIRIATRRSTLALWQARFVADHIRARAGLDTELVELTTSGDRFQSAPLSRVGGKGLFVKELEEALRDGRADVAVHSMKDVPAELGAEFVIPVIAFREDPADVLVSRSGRALAELQPGAVVGSSSLRRRAQILARRADLDVQPVRGNVDTRLRRLDEGRYDALVLAAAGLKRLGLEGRVTERLSLEVCLPAPGQGALGIECRAGDAGLISILAALNDTEVARCVRAERAVSAGLGADCTLPIAAHAITQGETIRLRAALSDAEGRRLLVTQVHGSDPEAVGHDAARELLANGGVSILEQLRGGAGAS